MAFAGLLRGYASELIAKAREEDAAGLELGASARVVGPQQIESPVSMVAPPAGHPASGCVAAEEVPAGKNHFVP
jgi:hypothetical protein